MKPITSALFVVSIIGSLFSGYLSVIKLLTTSCALNEPCPYFLGYPSCYFGFALFLALAIISGVLRFGSLPARRAARVLTAVSVLGVLFAARFTVPEIASFARGTGYTLGLPTCAYGLVFFAAALVLSMKLLWKAKRESLAF